jgi:hypothetical protein
MTITEKPAAVKKAPAKAPSKAVATKVAAKPVAKVTAKPAVKPVVQAKAAAAPAVKAKPAAQPAAVKPVKVKKPKMVRDSLTMPKLEYAVLDTLKLRGAKLASPVKKTELIRAGIKALAAMSDAAFLSAIKAVPSLKTGRPANTRAA